MKKKYNLLILIMLLSFVLTGCGNAIPDLSEEETLMVDTYMAELLLKYDENYSTKLLEENEIDKEIKIRKEIEEEEKRRAEREAAREKAEQEKKESVSSNSASSGGKAEAKDNAVDLEAFLDIEDFSVECTGVTFEDSYADAGDEMFFSITPSSGCKIAVSHLRITNNSSEAKILDILNKGARFKLSFNSGPYHNTMVSILLSDFTMYSGNINAGESIDLVMLVDLPESECVEVDDLDLNIKYNGESGRCSLIGEL